MILTPEKITSQRNLLNNTLRGSQLQAPESDSIEVGKYCHRGSMAWVEELHAKDNFTEASRLLNVLCKNGTWGLLKAKLGQKSGRCPH